MYYLTVYQGYNITVKLAVQLHFTKFKVGYIEQNNNTNKFSNMANKGQQVNPLIDGRVLKSLNDYYNNKMVSSLIYHKSTYKI